MLLLLLFQGSDELRMDMLGSHGQVHKDPTRCV